MTITMTKPIKALLGFKKSSAGDVLARGNAVLVGVYADKDDYTNPPIDVAAFKSQLDGLSNGISAALDGGKQAIAQREHQKEVVIKSLRQLGQYVEVACKDDMTIFLKSGFQPLTAIRTPKVPVSDHFRKIVAGKNSGHMEVTLVAQPDAFAYVLHYAAVGQGGALAPWVEADRENQARNSGIRVDARHDLRISGPCPNQRRLFRLERVGHSNRDIAV